MNIKKILGAKIRNLRKEKNLSQEYFAELVDLNPRQMVRIENGESFPTAENLERIASILNIEPQELFADGFYIAEDEMQKFVAKKLKEAKGDKLKALYYVALSL